ncbi:hypothetical protein L1987_86922 [Smallanthus sonchifolius]|uniref:Uncharacterized protein n=1 Tax=Smallanthus sonchifolius TaxID=185202 RepID=A0ACB8Y1H9_9ASTR|nr:hypothetical protein L1987_86922 [Smallanthus sonchifolius]
MSEHPTCKERKLGFIAHQSSGCSTWEKIEIQLSFKQTSVKFLATQARTVKETNHSFFYAIFQSFMVLKSNYQTNEFLDHETNEVDAKDESSNGDRIENHVGPASVTEPLYDDGAYENNEGTVATIIYNYEIEVDASLSFVNANIQKLSVQES